MTSKPIPTAEKSQPSEPSVAKIPDNHGFQIVGLVIANVNGNAKDSILKVEGKAGRGIRVRSYAKNGSGIGRIASNEAIGSKDIIHICKLKISTKGYGGRMGLPPAIECRAFYKAEITSPTAGPETSSLQVREVTKRRSHRKNSTQPQTI